VTAWSTAAEEGNASKGPLTDRNGSSETFFDVTIDTFESLPVRVTPVGVPEALRCLWNGSSSDSGRGCPGWITVHLGAGTSVLAADHHHAVGCADRPHPRRFGAVHSDLRIGGETSSSDRVSAVPVNTTTVWP
jgi:hypothetical protein